MNKELEIKAIETIIKEIRKINEKYQIRAEKERAKVDDVYITMFGEKVYIEDDINGFIEADYITASQSNKYIEKLQAKKEKAGEVGQYTKSEYICKCLDNVLYNFASELIELRKAGEPDGKID